MVSESIATSGPRSSPSGSAWTLRDLIASGDLPAVRPPRLRRVWIDKADLDRAISEWKEQGG